MNESLPSYSKYLALSARLAASSLSRVSTYTPSFFLALRANSSRREALGI